ncbi:nascent polypeptide-associated complex protein [Candidatus Woesearchaeota archaeon]|nr:nascent polypeptide-associated complex protein [Candidatus Woesearchaeota archaeon]
MFPGLNPKNMEKIMKQMGIKQEEIDADEVIIKNSSRNIIIKNPKVTKINMQGHETFQVTGDVQEEMNEEDVNTIMEQTGCSREEAEKALEKYEDLTEAIISLKE